RRSTAVQENAEMEFPTRAPDGCPFPSRLNWSPIHRLHPCRARPPSDTVMDKMPKPHATHGALRIKSPEAPEEARLHSIPQPEASSERAFLSSKAASISGTSAAREERKTRTSQAAFRISTGACHRTRCNPVRKSLRVLA